MMMFLAGFVGFLLVLTAEAGVGNTTASSLCKDTKECLLYEFICKGQDYEIRRIDSVKWISTSFTLSPGAQIWWLDLAALGAAFMRVKNYLDDHGMFFKAAPGTVKIPEEKNTWMSKIMNTQQYTLNFLLPSAHQNNYPQPTNPKVEIVETPEMYVYVRSYKGWLNKDAEQAKLLLKSLGMSGEVTPHFAVGYNSPFTSDPYSEVWVIADGKPQCPPPK